MNMKKRLFGLLILMLLSATYYRHEVNAASKFKIVDDCDEKVLKEYKGNERIVRVPDGVTEISGAFKNNSRIRKIILPNTVKNILAFSFEDLKNLKTVKLSKNLKYIEGSSFVKCPKIKKILIPKKCKRIDYGAFGGCEGLKTIKVEKGNKHFKVWKDALYSKNMKELILFPKSCKKYKTYVIPSTVKRLYDDAFQNNKYIEKLIVKGNITHVCDDTVACAYMKNLRCVIFKTKQTSKKFGIGFEGCQNLEKVILADGTKYIIYRQFADCKNLTQINLPDSLIGIAENAFEGCDKLVLPEIDESKIIHYPIY